MKSSYNDGSLIGVLILFGLFGLIGHLATCSETNANRKKYLENEEKRKQKELDLYNRAVETHASDDYMRFLKEYNSKNRSSEYYSEIDDLFWQRTIEKSMYERYLRVALKGKYTKAAKDSIDENLWSKSKANSSYNSYIEYYNDESLVNAKYWDIAQDSVAAIEKRKWQSDNLAWETALSINSIDGFEKYLKLYPKGKRANEASKRIIDLEVDEVFKGDYGRLPSMDNIKNGSKARTSKISIFNNTKYTLVLRYSGTDSKQIVLSPGERNGLTLENGTYRVAASASSSKVRNYAGTEVLSGGEYNVEYYISTSRY